MANQKKLFNNTSYSKISVIMSIYNGERHLKEAVDSILNQTFKNFEFIIINDGSTDRTGRILKKYRKQDDRIKIINNKKNIGLTKSLNKGIRFSQGKYIARMDADDISLPKRLEKQLNFMEEHPKIGAVGCWYYLIDKNSKIFKKIQPPINFFKIKKAFINSSPIIHPGSMIKKIFLEKINLYDEKFKYSQDRDLWLRIMKYCQLAVIPEFLLKFRYSSESISAKNEIEQKKCCLKAIRGAIKNKTYPKWYYVFTLRYLISICLPKPIWVLKNKILNFIGLRYDQKRIN